MHSLAVFMTSVPHTLISSSLKSIAVFNRTAKSLTKLCGDDVTNVLLWYEPGNLHMFYHANSEFSFFFSAFKSLVRLGHRPPRWEDCLEPMENQLDEKPDSSIEPVIVRLSTNALPTELCRCYRLDSRWKRKGELLSHMGRAYHS